MYMLAAGTAGESRKEILDVLSFGDVFESNDASQILEPFKAYSNLIESITSQPNKGYALEIGNVYCFL